jgi:hypothetical protein
MEEEQVERRGFLLFLLIVAGGVLTTLLGIINELVSRDAEGQTHSTPVSDATETPLPDAGARHVVDVREFGAKADGSTDDSKAIRQALNTVGPGGTVRLPQGRIVISTDGSDDTAIRLSPGSGVTIEGAGAGPSGTRLVMGSGHTENHFGIKIGSNENDSAEASQETAGEVVIRDMIVDGNWSEQRPPDGDWQNGFGIEIRNIAQKVTIENCVFEKWVTNGGLMAAGGIKIRNSTFRKNGMGVKQEGRQGHGFNVNTADGSGRVIVENCLFDGNVGQAIDSRGGKVTVRNSVMRIEDGAIKLNGPTEDVRLENVHIKGGSNTRIPIRCVPTGDEGTGTLRLNSVIIENAKWPAIDLPRRPGSVKGDNILIKNVSRENHRDAGFYIEGEREMDIGAISIHDVGGAAVQFSGATGVIEELTFSGASELGEIGDVVIKNILTGTPIEVSVPAASDVGAMVKSTTTDTE